MLNPNFVCNHLDAFSAIYLGLGVYEWGAGGSVQYCACGVGFGLVRVKPRRRGTKS